MHVCMQAHDFATIASKGCRSAHLVFHGAINERQLQPPVWPRRDTSEERTVRLAKYVVVLSKPCDGLSATLWNVTGCAYCRRTRTARRTAWVQLRQDLMVERTITLICRSILAVRLCKVNCVALPQGRHSSTRHCMREHSRHG